MILGLIFIKYSISINYNMSVRGCKKRLKHPYVLATIASFVWISIFISLSTTIIWNWTVINNYDSAICASAESIENRKTAACYWGRATVVAYHKSKPSQLLTVNLQTPPGNKYILCHTKTKRNDWSRLVNTTKYDCLVNFAKKKGVTNNVEDIGGWIFMFIIGWLVPIIGWIFTIYYKNNRIRTINMTAIP